MSRSVLAIISLLANFTLAFLAFSPRMVTFAQVAPKGIACSSCTTPDVQAALVAAADAGRSQVLGIIAPLWLVVLLALASSAACLLMIMLKRNK